MHLCLSHLIDPRALLKDFHYLVADSLKFDMFRVRRLAILDVVVDLTRQDKVNIKFTCVVILRNQISILE